MCGREEDQTKSRQLNPSCLEITNVLFSVNYVAERTMNTDGGFVNLLKIVYVM
jgi:hypothetical protein